jgi:hypothetical protein
MARNKKESKDQDSKVQKRIEWCLKHKIKHFAPTISPAPKDAGNIESIAEALRYYNAMGVDKVCIQPKYMGSYVDIELTKDINETRFFSRRGYLIKYLDRDKLIDAIRDLHKTMFEVEPLAEKFLIQGELLPWIAMGENLIERDYKTYSTLIQNHINDLNEMDFFNTVEELKLDLKYQEFSEYYSSLINKFKEEYPNLPSDERYKLIRKELYKKYKQHIVRQYLGLYHTPAIQDAIQESLNKFNEQLNIYAYDSDVLEVKPFNLLKTYYSDGKFNVNESNIEGFNLVSNDDQLVLSFEENGFDLCVELAEDYYKSLVNEDNEGVMIKPESVYAEGLNHAFKVRNNDYLMLIY